MIAMLSARSRGTRGPLPLGPLAGRIVDLGLHGRVYPSIGNNVLIAPRPSTLMHNRQICASCS